MPPQRLASVPDDQRQRLEPTAAMVGASIEIDLLDATRAPTVDEAPVGRGMLLVQLSLFSTDPGYDAIRPGEPYLMTQAGGWRRFDLQRYGFGSRTYGELSTALSHDGRRVALADPSGLAVVDLRDGTFRRFDLPVHHAVALQWTADRSVLLLKDRHSGRRPCGPKGCALDLTTGELTTVPYDLFRTTHDAAGRAVEVRAGANTRPAQVVIHQEEPGATTVDLPFRTSPSTAGGPVAAEHVAYSQCPHARRPRDPGGVVVVDPVSGDFIAMLANEQGEGCLGAQAWLTDRHLLVDHWESGSIWLWDISGGRPRQVASSRTTGIHVAVARGLVVDRLRRHLHNR
ncbi:hypothetical protein [Nocardioides deserti]|uniref:Uncharacterized protein n=1 Tax=Nocardioides deserti TaxID=1588644 RepID=A0ABR6U8L0_9ACTN|nr:hypothetical protein [Nocardioides deserti]MBC2960176.1 hypothetical protein [Nocardioides deserti]GGO74698.1 hypothetical protein GCM10012276_23280 [Nocardioides deserti]